MQWVNSSRDLCGCCGDKETLWKLSGFFALFLHRGAATPTPQASVSPLGILMLIGKVLSGLAHEFLKHDRIAKKQNKTNKKICCLVPSQ